MKNHKDNAEKLSAKIKNIFGGSEDELEQEIQLFHAKKAQKQKELENTEVRLKENEFDHKKSAQRTEDCDRKLHLLMQDRQREQDLFAEKAEYIIKLCEDLKIQVDFDVKNDNDRAAGLVANIRAAMQKENDRIQEIKASNEREDEEKMKKIQKYREQSAELKSEINSATKQLNESQSTLDNQKQQLRLVEQSGVKLKAIRTQIEGIQKAKEQRLAGSNTQGLREEIEQHRTEKRNVAEKLEEVDDQITYLSSMASILAEVNTKKKSLEKHDAEVMRLKNKHKNSFQRLFPGEVVESDFKRKIDALFRTLNLDSNRLDAKIRLKETHTNNFKLQIQNKKTEQKTAETEKRHLEEEVDKVCEQSPYEEVLAMTRENVTKLQMEYSSYKSSEVFYKK